MATALILVLVGLTSAAAWVAGLRGLRWPPVGLRVALIRVIEGARLAAVFLALNLVGFVSGVAYRSWLDRG